MDLRTLCSGEHPKLVIGRISVWTAYRRKNGLFRSHVNMESNETLVIAGSDIFPKELHRSEQLGFDMFQVLQVPTIRFDPITRRLFITIPTYVRIAHQTLHVFVLFSFALCSPTHIKLLGAPLEYPRSYHGKHLLFYSPWILSNSSFYPSVVFASQIPPLSSFLNLQSTPPSRMSGWPKIEVQ